MCSNDTFEHLCAMAVCQVLGTSQKKCAAPKSDDTHQQYRNSALHTQKISIVLRKILVLASENLD